MAEYKLIAKGGFLGGPVTYGSGTGSSTETCRWEVQIWRYSEMVANVWSLNFPEDPLKIEWMETDENSPIQGSTAELRVISEGDREFISYVTVNSGPIILRVYRDDVLFWQGTFDPEFYDEPYESSFDYEVTLRFADFGFLKRIDYERPPSQPNPYVLTANTAYDTLGAILARALHQSKFLMEPLPQNVIPDSWETLSQSEITYASASGSELTVPVSAMNVGCRVDNFFDEEGQPCTYYDAIEAIAKPLGIRIVQRGGVVRIYDLHNLYSVAPVYPIEWTGDAQNLSSSETYWQVKVNFSPYELSELIDGKFEIDKNTEVAGNPVRVFHYEWVTDDDDVATGAVTHRDGYGLELYNYTGIKNPAPKGVAGDASVYYTHISPLLTSCDDCDVINLLTPKNKVRGLTPPGQSAGWGDPTYVSPLGSLPNFNGQSVFEPSQARYNSAYRSDKIWIPALTDAQRRRYQLRVSCELLLDVRDNPFVEEENDCGRKDDYEVFRKMASMVFMPCSLILYSANDKDTPVGLYTNRRALRVQPIDTKRRKVEAFIGGRETGWLEKSGTGWVKKEKIPAGRIDADVAGGSMVLQWWQEDPCSGKAAVSGWTANKTPIGVQLIAQEISESIKKMDDGVIIPMPPSSGYLQFEIYDRVFGFPYADSYTEFFYGAQAKPIRVGDCANWRLYKVFERLRWWMIRNPKVEIIDTWRGGQSVSAEDICYEGYIGGTPKGDLSIDTIVGTMRDASPASRGLLTTNRGEPISTLRRGNVELSPEKMLIGSAVSQNRERKVQLSGECLPGKNHLALYRDRAGGSDRDGDHLFMIASETLDCRTLTSEITYREVFPDIYTPSEWDGEKQPTPPSESGTDQEEGGQLPSLEEMGATGFPSVYRAPYLDDNRNANGFYGPQIEI